MKGFTSLFPLLSSWKVVVQDLLLFKKRKTTDTGTLRASKPSSMTLNFINNGFPTTTFGNDNKNRIRTRQLSSPSVSVGDLL